MSARRTVFIPLSGFLGAGKTTLMLAAAGLLRGRGLAVACITNDQGNLLVDSNMVESQGFALGQVRGGCFCCRFDELTDTLQLIMADRHPDVILAEAVGSCTDLTATVIRPLQTMYGDTFRAVPLTSVIDPVRLEDMIQAETGGDSSRLSPDVAYIFRKQLEEASHLVLNKTDLLPPVRTEWLLTALRHEFPEARVLPAASAEGRGVAEWLDAIMSSAVTNGRPALDIDYDRYADGEAQLGWLNSSVSVEGEIEDVSGLCGGLVAVLTEEMKRRGAEIAHLKLWAQDEANRLKISVIRSDDAVRTDVQPASQWRSGRIAVWLNARIQMPPTELKESVLNGLAKLRAGYGVQTFVHELECFAPSRPVPTYRMGETT